jgi:tetratricopeptide (TPR) repeat protein
VVEVYRTTIQKGPLGVLTDEVRPDTHAVATAEQAYALAMGLNDRGRPDEAIPLLQTALVLDDGYDDAVVELGATFQDVGRSSDAVDAFQQFLVAHPGRGRVRLEFAACLARQSRLEEAISHCRLCIDREPEWAAPYMSLISALCRLERPLEARQNLEIFQGLGPDPRTVSMLDRLIERTERRHG